MGTYVSTHKSIQKQTTAKPPPPNGKKKWKWPKKCLQNTTLFYSPSQPLKCCNPSENDQHFALIFFAWGLKKE